MSPSIGKRAATLITVSGVLIGTMSLTFRPAAAPPTLRAVPAAPATPDDEKALNSLLNQYSKAYDECKALRRKLATVVTAVPPRFTALQRDLLGKQESICQQTAAGNSAKDYEESRKNAEIGGRLLHLASQKQHWQDSVKGQTSKQLVASSKLLENATISLRQALGAKTKGFKFHLHGITYLAYVADLRDDNIALHLNQDSTSHSKFSTLDRLRDFYVQRGQAPAMLTNAGMFHANQEPVGLLIENGVVVRPLNVQKPATDENFYMQPNGVFSVDANHIGHVDSTGGFQRSWQANQRQSEVREATQSGPMLVINNRVNSHFSELSTNAKVRSGVGIMNSSGNAGGRVVFLTTEGESTFYDFATTLRDLFSCSNALFLDGAISKMYLAGEQTSYTGGFFGPMVSVVSRASLPKPLTALSKKPNATAKKEASTSDLTPAKTNKVGDSIPASSGKNLPRSKAAIALPVPAAEAVPNAEKPK